jgi:hypothetical protein
MTELKLEEYERRKIHRSKHGDITDADKLQRLIHGLDEYCKVVNAKEGILLARNLSEKLGADVINNSEGGIIIHLGLTTIHVFQPYPDIDRIYYEY